MKIKKKTIAKLSGNTERTVENGEKEQRLILVLLNQYINEDMAQELPKTQKIRNLENLQITKNSRDIEEHVLFHALRKIQELPNLFLVGKKQFWLTGFLEVLESVEIFNKKELIDKIESLDQRFYESSNWKKLTNDFLERNFSEYEIEVIMLNKDKVIKGLN